MIASKSMPNRPQESPEQHTGSFMRPVETSKINNSKRVNSNQSFPLLSEINSYVHAAVTEGTGVGTFVEYVNVHSQTMLAATQCQVGFLFFEGHLRFLKSLFSVWGCN